MVTKLEDPGPFRIKVYDKNFAFKFNLGGCSSVSITPRHLALGTGSITIPFVHDRAPWIFDQFFNGAVRAVIDYRIGDDMTDNASWVHGMSGYLTAWTKPDDGKPSSGSEATFTISDDYWLMSWMDLWPNPTAAITSQTANAYDTRTGHAETVIKAYVTANATRLGIPLTTATNSNRGATVTGNYRFDNANDVLPLLAQAASLGISAKQVGTGVVLDVYAGTDRTAQPYTEANGGILGWSGAATVESATRAIVAAQGTGTARAFSERPASLPSALETETGRRIEAFVDARDTSDATTLAQRGDAALVTGLPGVGYTATLAETDLVKSFKNLFVGDTVALQLAPGIPLFSDVVSSITATWSTTNGLVVTPVVGISSGAASPDQVLTTVLSRVAKDVRYLRSSL